MTRDEMLRHVASEGENAGSDYNDGLDGWFGFTIEDHHGIPALVATWKSAGAPGGAKQRLSWLLTPVEAAS